MRKHTWQYALTLILAYMLLMAVIFFAYVEISNNYILKQAEKELVVSTEDVASLFSLQVNYDYQRFADIITETTDPILDINPSDFDVLDQSLLGLGTIDGRDVTINGQTYTYQPQVFNVDFNQQFAIYDFNDAFNTSDFGGTYFVFKVNEYIGFFDANIFVSRFFESNELIDNYFIISTDNRIFYSSQSNETYPYFNDYFREAGYQQSYINDFTSAIYSLQSGILETRAFTGDDYLTYAPIHIQQTTESGMYFTFSYASSSVRLSLSYLTGVLWAMFFIIFIIYSIATLFIYKILSKRIEDIHDARLKLFYTKPFIVKIKKDGYIKSYNRSFSQFLGDQDIYDNISDFRIKEEEISTSLSENIDRQKPFTALFQKDEELKYIRFIPTRAQGGFILVGDDVSQSEGKFDEYKTLALMNNITQLPNKNSLMQVLDDLFKNEERIHKKNALIAFEIDNFSKISLLLGKKSADHFLRLVSDYALETLEGYPSMLFNLEGDLFVVLLENIENYQWVHLWMQKLNEIFSQPLTIDRNLLNIHLKFGIFLMENEKYEILNPQVCIENMTLALEHAKSNTTKNYFIYDVSLSIVASRSNRMEMDLAKAITNQEFKMVFQPQYNNEEERIVGFEALIRWNNPRYASESPLKFIRMAEQNSMIIDIGRIALHETFLAAKELEHYNVEISLNISPVQMLQAGFVNEIISVFEQYELKKGAISLEITETFLIDSFELVIAKLNILRKYGFNIHLDDFGTGYSSLQYLKDLPINAIKIDKTFIDGVEEDAHSRAIVHMISNLAKDIGLNVIAEGVETQKQNQLIYKGGCDIIQGYMISAPVPKEQAIQLIKAYNLEKTKSVSLIKNKKEVRRK